jgi:glucoamylase
VKASDSSNDKEAPGHPGVSPTWTSSAKDGVGTSISRGSLVWFTLSEGIINEVYYPRIDQANIRDFQFIVTDNSDLFEEEKRNCDHNIKPIEQGVPAFKIINTSQKNYYTNKREIR